MICAVYVDDTIFWSPNDANIDKTISKLKALKFELTDQREVDPFLGIKTDTAKDETITMSQLVLIETIIRSLGLKDDSK